MTRFTTTLLLAGVAVLSLGACTDSKGPGALGSKNDIVVKNNGLPGEKQNAPRPGEGFSSTVETAEANPPAEVAAGEPVPAPEGTEVAEPLPSDDPAVVAAAEKVEESKAPVPAATSTPVTDGTTASTAPATDTVPADVVAPEAVKDQREVTPPPLEGTASAEEKAAGAPITQARSSVYPSSDYPTTAPQPTAETPTPTVSTSADVATTATNAAPVPTPAPEPVVPAAEVKPGTKGTAYEMGMTGKSAVAAAPVPATTETAAAVPTSGTVNPYDPAIIKAAQSALKTKAGYTGAANGELSSEFLNAISKYQNENKLTPGGVNIETLRHLGVIE